MVWKTSGCRTITIIDLLRKTACTPMSISSSTRDYACCVSVCAISGHWLEPQYQKTPVFSQAAAELDFEDGSVNVLCSIPQAVAEGKICAHDVLWCTSMAEDW
jgi:hypothetical protein